jgi:sirohydrochlorin cobaltochelatase
MATLVYGSVTRPHLLGRIINRIHMVGHTKMKHGIVLFSHGSRDPLWHKPMEAVARQIEAGSSDSAVVCAFLELSTPDLSDATKTLLNMGVQHITIVPMFLGVGRHAREDLPLLVDNLRVLHPRIQFTLKPAVGEDPRLIQMLAEIALTESSP